ncbi:MAG: glycoside hydrolase family 25 protein [Bacteroidaceae bacterium]|nr:glycoside hydrolase family 25 protein [Bacteroidaceae bacterium]
MQANKSKYRQPAGRSASLKTKKKTVNRSRGISFPKKRLWSLCIGALAIVSVSIFILYYIFVDQNSFSWKQVRIEEFHPEGYHVRGIDISHYQQEINWERLRNANLLGNPIRFIIIKATEGISIMDDNFNENFYQAKQNGFIRGAYHFFIPEIDAERQAHFFMHQVHLEPGDLPPVLDVEKRGNLSNSDLEHAVKKWMDIVELHYHVKPILYTGYKFRTSVLRNPQFNDYPFWIAHYYVKNLSYKGEWKFWQYTDAGHIDGIDGEVDCNSFNGTLNELINLTLKE